MTTATAAAAEPTMTTSDPASRRASAARAVDFRGDVTVRLRGGAVVEGFAFDARLDGSPTDCLRLLCAGSDERITLLLAEVESIECTGKDAANGRAWENWVRRYAEAKSAGRAASIESESLDDADQPGPIPGGTVL